MLSSDTLFALPGFPTEIVFDPTGAGDSFAGGLMGKLAEDGSVDNKSLCRALAYGTVTASFTIESFGTDRLCEIDREELEERLEKYKEYTQIP